MEKKAIYKNQVIAKRTIAIASGKGGVGKSTVAANIAIALAKNGYKVGLLDTDVFGPSVSKMFGTNNGDILITEEKKMTPVEKYGVKTMSMGNLVPEGQAVMWRGPMVHSVVTQFVENAVWGELDFFIMDLPPGTGDIQLSIMQTLKIDSAVIVSTPQTMSLIDVSKCVDMFRKMGIEIEGLIENMAYFECDGCGKKHYIFGNSGAAEYAKKEGLNLISQLPLENKIMQSCEDGQPYAINKDTEGHFDYIAELLEKKL